MDYAAIWHAAWPVITAIVAIASALDAAMPQPAPGSHWLIVRKVISFLAVNVGHASNGQQPDFVTWIVRIAAPVLQAQGAMPRPASEPSPQPAPPATAGTVVPLILLAMMGAGMLSGCASKPPATQVFELRAGYDAAVLAPMAAYAKLPACPAGAAPASAQAAPPVCFDPSVLEDLRKADAAAKAALDAAEDTVRQHPTMDASAAIAGAENAVAAARTILATYNIN